MKEKHKGVKKKKKQPKPEKRQRLSKVRGTATNPKDRKTGLKG
jgi:hypothetical protein